MKPDPLGTPRHPLVVYLLGLGALSGATDLLGQPTAGSIESELDPAARIGWALFLLLGCLATLAGMYWQGDQRTGLLLKRWGYLALTVAGTVYAVVLLGRFGVSALLLGMIILGFAVSCGVMVRRLSRLIELTIP